MDFQSFLQISRLSECHCWRFLPLLGSSSVSVLAERVVAPPTPRDSVCRGRWGHAGPFPPSQLLWGCHGTQEPRAQGQPRALWIRGSHCQAVWLLEAPRLLADC